MGVNITTIEQGWKTTGGARNSMQFNYNASIKADDPNSTNRVGINYKFVITTSLTSSNTLEILKINILPKQW